MLFFANRHHHNNIFLERKRHSLETNYNLIHYVSTIGGKPTKIIDIYHIPSNLTTKNIKGVWTLKDIFQYVDVFCRLSEAKALQECAKLVDLETCCKIVLKISI